MRRYSLFFIMGLSVIFSPGAFAVDNASDVLNKIQQKSVVEAEEKKNDSNQQIKLQSKKGSNIKPTDRISLSVENTTTYHSIRVKGKR